MSGCFACGGKGREPICKICNTPGARARRRSRGTKAKTKPRLSFQDERAAEIEQKRHLTNISDAERMLKNLSKVSKDTDDTFPQQLLDGELS